MQDCIKISVEDYFCDKCEKFYCWQAKSNKSRKMMIHCPEFDMKKDYLLFVKYSHKNLDKKKLSLIYIRMMSKKPSQYKNKFSFEKRKFQNEKIIIFFSLDQKAKFCSFNRQVIEKKFVRQNFYFGNMKYTLKGNIA